MINNDCINQATVAKALKAILSTFLLRHDVTAPLCTYAVYKMSRAVGAGVKGVEDWQMHLVRF